MTILYPIEYCIIDGKVNFKDVTGDNFLVLCVEFEAYPDWENDGIGGYEWWGAPGYDKGTDYVSLERNGNPEWDKSAFTDDENAIVDAFTGTKEWEKLAQEFCDEYEKEYNEHKDEMWYNRKRNLRY